MNARTANDELNAAPDQVGSIIRLESKREAMGRKRKAAQMAGLADLVRQVDRKLLSINVAISAANSGTLTREALGAALSSPEASIPRQEPDFSHTTPRK